MGQKSFDEKIMITPTIQSILDRANIYLKVRIPVHLTGPAGTGKTTLALKLADDLKLKVYFIQGDISFNRNDLIGGLFGYSQKIIEDNFIPSVSKMERKVVPIWVDNPVALACREGAVLVYDEFTRARPETNNVLLSILSEKVLMTADESGRMTLEKVHPGFTLILTSNPKEYSGVTQAQDALLDRVINIRLSNYDEETEASIVSSQNNLDEHLALRIVRFIKELSNRYDLPHSSLRTSIKLGKICAQLKYESDNTLFYKCCRDIMGLDSVDLGVLAETWAKGV